MDKEKIYKSHCFSIHTKRNRTPQYFTEDNRKRKHYNSKYSSSIKPSENKLDKQSGAAKRNMLKRKMSKKQPNWRPTYEWSSSESVASTSTEDYHSCEQTNLNFTDQPRHDYEEVVQQIKHINNKIFLNLASEANPKNKIN